MLKYNYTSIGGQSEFNEINLWIIVEIVYDVNCFEKENKQI
jgi:hypothetical protein